MSLLYKLIATVDTRAVDRLFDGSRLSIGLEGGNGDIGKHTLWDLIARARDTKQGNDLLVAGTVPLQQFILSLQGRLEKQMVVVGSRMVARYEELPEPHQWSPKQQKLYIDPRDISQLSRDGIDYIIIDAGKPSETTLQYRMLKGDTPERAAFFGTRPIDVLITSVGIKTNEESNALMTALSPKIPLVVTGPLDATSRSASRMMVSEDPSRPETPTSPKPITGEEERFSFTTFRVSDPTGTAILASTHLENIPTSLAVRLDERLTPAFSKLAENPHMTRFVSIDHAITTAKSVSGTMPLSTLSAAPRIDIFRDPPSKSKRARLNTVEPLMNADLNLVTFFDNQSAYASLAVAETAIALGRAYHTMTSAAQANLALPIMVSIAGLLGTDKFPEMVEDGHRIFSSSSCTSNSSLVRTLWTFASLYIALHPDIELDHVPEVPIATIRAWAATAYKLYHRNTAITAIHASTHSDLGNSDADTLRLQKKASGSETQVKRVWAEFVEEYADMKEVSSTLAQLELES